MEFFLIILLIFCIIMIFVTSKKQKEIKNTTKCSSNNEQLKNVQVNMELDTFNKDIYTNLSEDYLNTKLEDGLTIREHIQQGYINALEHEKNSSNPVFHRTLEEDELGWEFSRKHNSHISKLENIIYSNEKDEEWFTLEDIKRNIDKCNDSIKAYYDLKEFCYKYKGGKIYFQDTWECLHNSQNDCFEYVEELKEKKIDLQELYEDYKNYTEENNLN